MSGIGRSGKESHISHKARVFRASAICIFQIAFLILFACEPPEEIPDVKVTFALTSDIHLLNEDAADNFREACSSMALLEDLDFIVTTGDIIDPDLARTIISETFGSDLPWYPVVGNHDFETADPIEWIREANAEGNSLPSVVNPGPPGGTETTYSFEYAGTHFVVLNIYYDETGDTATTGDISTALYDWLIQDLETYASGPVFVFGHEPAYPLPDEESGRIRHEFDSLNAYPSRRDTFWNALSDYNVTAYACGHTHNYSSALLSGVWQINCARTFGTTDTESRSTFIIITVREDITASVYRLDTETNEYELSKHFTL